MELNKISQRVYADTKGETGGNVGVISLDQSVVAVDSQFPVSGIEFRRNIRNIISKPVSHLLLTHFHGDHVFGNQAFEDCAIVAHRLLKEKMVENLRTIWTPPNLEKIVEEVKMDRPERAWLYEGLRIVLPNIIFDEKFTLEGIEMTRLGGHTSDSSVVYINDDRILLAGDILFAKTFPWGGDPSANPDEWILAFEKILKMDIETIIPGHGPICDKSEIEIQLNWFREVREVMKRLISNNISTEIAINYNFPNFYNTEREDRKLDTLKHWYMFWMKK
jgi:glyoxylase-like metal-dependent hydrolase (beta-lactamase superfamily II)